MEVQYNVVNLLMTERLAEFLKNIKGLAERTSCRCFRPATYYGEYPK
jgi:hypothetical protein